MHTFQCIEKKTEAIEDESILWQNIHVARIFLSRPSNSKRLQLMAAQFFNTEHIHTHAHFI